MIKMRAESDSGTFCFKVFRNRVGYYVNEDALRSISPRFAAFVARFNGGCSSYLFVEFLIFKQFFT